MQWRSSSPLNFKPSVTLSGSIYFVSARKCWKECLSLFIRSCRHVCCVIYRVACFWSPVNEFFHFVCFYKREKVYASSIYVHTVAFSDAKFDCVQIVDLRLSPILQIMSNIKLQSKQIIRGGRFSVWCSLQLFNHTSPLIVWIKQIQPKADIYTVTKHCQIFHHWTFGTSSNTACFLLKSWSIFERKKKIIFFWK